MRYVIDNISLNVYIKHPKMRTCAKVNNINKLVSVSLLSCFKP